MKKTERIKNPGGYANYRLDTLKQTVNLGIDS
jgi:hypothetical protein